MDFLSVAFNELLLKPLINILVLLYALIPGADLGVVIIVLTILIRVVLYPLSHKALKSQKALAELQPKIKELQEKYKNDKEKQAKATMELYQQEHVNPFSGCAPLLLQLPLFIALFQLFRVDFAHFDSNLLYSFVHPPSSFDTTFFGLIDLAKASKETWAGKTLALITGLSQYFQSKTLSSQQSLKPQDKSQFSQMMQMQMTYMMPIFTVFIVWSFAAGIALYWLVTTLFSIFQQYLINKKTSSN